MKKIVLLSWNGCSWLPGPLSLFQKLHRNIKLSNCLTPRLLGDTQLRPSVQTCLLGFKTFRLLLRCGNISMSDSGAGCNEGLRPVDWVCEVKGSRNLPGIWQKPPCRSVVRIFSQNILVFQVIFDLKSWEVFREIWLSHLPVGKRTNCTYSFPSLNVLIPNSIQRLNWFLSFHLLSSSEEHF